MSQGAKTRLTLVGRDHAERDRQQFLGDRNPSAIFSVALIAVAFTVTAAALYYGTAFVLYGLIWLQMVLR